MQLRCARVCIGIGIRLCSRAQYVRMSGPMKANEVATSYCVYTVLVGSAPAYLHVI
jgi:hypothetical protein